MPNHGYCRNCWWHKDGICYMQFVYTKDDSYCPDYVNRNKLNKKGTLDDLITKWKSEGVTFYIEDLYERNNNQ